jgi:hypothetical protein
VKLVNQARWNGFGTPASLSPARSRANGKN